MKVNPAEIRTFCTELYTRAAEVAKTKQSGNIRVGDILVAVEQLKREKGTQYAGKVQEFLNKDYENNETGELKSLADLYKQASVSLSEKDKGEKKPLAKLGTVLTKITDTTEQLDRSTRTSILLAQLQFSGTGNLLRRIGVVLMEFFRSISRIGGLPQEQKITINNKIAQLEKFVTEKLTVLMKEKRPSELSADMKKTLQELLKDELKLDTLPKNLKTKIEAELNGFIGEITAFLEYEEQKEAAKKLAQVSQEMERMTEKMKAPWKEEPPQEKSATSASPLSEDKAIQKGAVGRARQVIEDLAKVENTTVHIEQGTQSKLQTSFPTLAFGGDKQHPTFDMKSLMRCVLEKIEEGDLGTRENLGSIFEGDPLAKEDIDRIEAELPKYT